MKTIKKSVILIMLTLFFLNPLNIYANGDPTEREWRLFGTDTYEITNGCTTTIYERQFFFGFVISVEVIDFYSIC